MTTKCPFVLVHGSNITIYQNINDACGQYLKLIAESHHFEQYEGAKDLKLAVADLQASHKLTFYKFTGHHVPTSAVSLYQLNEYFDPAKTYTREDLEKSFTKDMIYRAQQALLARNEQARIDKVLQVGDWIEDGHGNSGRVEYISDNDRKIAITFDSGDLNVLQVIDGAPIEFTCFSWDRDSDWNNYCSKPLVDSLTPLDNVERLYYLYADVCFGQSHSDVRFWADTNVWRIPAFHDIKQHTYFY